MSARLIVNADDFGLTRGINRAIAELHEAGALASATLMANGTAFEDAVAIGRAHPGLGVGCHIVLTDGVPLLPAQEVPTLLGPDGRSFRPSLLGFLLAVLSGRVSSAEIVREAVAQIERLQHAGIDVTHIDTHKHTHILPRVARPLLEAAEGCGIRAIRNPFEPVWSRSLPHRPRPSPLLRRLQVGLIHYLRPRFLAIPQIRNGRVRTTDGTLGVSATGNLNASTLRLILDAMPDGVWELVCHPGYNDRDLDAVATRLRETREIEREALLAWFGDGSDGISSDNDSRNNDNDLSKNVHPSQIQLIHYKDLDAGRSDEQSSRPVAQESIEEG
jgi:predicted glycoside hydrolase/deacetylase ChbG (UPF0249 family)